jgi:hypothetical protein
MYRRRSPRLAAALALAGLIPVSGTTAQDEAAPGRGVPVLAGATAAPPAVLKSAYHLVLTSTWPQETTTGGCRNGGSETVRGTLIRDPDGTYIGRFTRRTQLLFCGSHGAGARGCALELNGRGSVAMTGVVLNDDTSPSGRSLRVTWTPLSGHEASLSGACPSGFKDAMRAMYLSTPHGAEFPATTEGQGPRRERLENYAWEVDLE